MEKEKPKFPDRNVFCAYGLEELILLNLHITQRRLPIKILMVFFTELGQVIKICMIS